MGDDSDGVDSTKEITDTKTMQTEKEKVRSVARDQRAKPSQDTSLTILKTIAMRGLAAVVAG